NIAAVSIMEVSIGTTFQPGQFAVSWSASLWSRRPSHSFVSLPRISTCFSTMRIDVPLVVTHANKSLYPWRLFVQTARPDHFWPGRLVRSLLYKLRGRI